MKRSEIEEVIEFPWACYYYSLPGIEAEGYFACLELVVGHKECMTKGGKIVVAAVDRIERKPELEKQEGVDKAVEHTKGMHQAN